MTTRYLLDLESNTIHIIVFDGDVIGGVYRQAVSFSWVFCSGSKKQAKWRRKNLKAMYKYEPVTHMFFRRNPALKLITHYSLWDFYKYIGYDHKKSNLEALFYFPKD